MLAPCDDPQRSAKIFSHKLRKEAFHAKATHNTYARRCERDDGFVTEGYFDDGEK
jgi:putative IMPACT (imprinted ancient) family translation regulator